ncbi:MAG: hypothetical protein DRO95_02935 [Candidatus Altiarchaeales archaeon]|nr:MAG: hypothetical protein DRO95_02935 [Candidatus Altiarchaeales archaeon]HDO82355.1 hypothetical protein [Candidatus Altiarchaeales archaeon]HEX55004.1 hypothetical protein [Candidatus Altiarchaeales archaeon]
MRISILIVIMMMYCATAQVSARGTLSINYTIGDSINSMALLDSKIVVGSDNNYIYLYEDYTNLKWSHNLGDEVNSVSISERYVAGGTVNGNVSVFDHNGTLIFQTKLDSYIPKARVISIMDDYMIVGTMDGFVYAFDILDNEMLWRVKTDAYVVTLNLMDNEIVAVSDKRIFILDMEGEVMRTINFTSNVYIRSAHISENYIAIGLSNNDLVVVNLFGDEILRKNLYDNIGVLYLYGGYVAAGCRDKRVYIFDLVKDEGIKFDLSDVVVDVAMMDGNVVAVARDGNVYLLTLGGRTAYKYLVDGGESRALLSKDYLIVGTSLGGLYYFKLHRDTRLLLFIGFVMCIVIIWAIIFMIRSIRY